MESNKFLISNFNNAPANKIDENNSQALVKAETKYVPMIKDYSIGKKMIKSTAYNPENEDIEMMQTLHDMRTSEKSSGKIDPFAGRVVRYNEEFFNGLLKQFDRTFLSKLVDLHNSMSKKKVNLNEVDNLLEFFINYKKELTNSYLYALIFPERCKGVRIPVKFPTPSLTFSQKSNLTIIPNTTTNNWFLQWTPQTLLSSAFVTANQGNLLLNTAAALTGSAVDATGTNYVSQTVDRLQNANMIQAYRLVSASLIVSYVGSVDAHSGVIGGGVDVSYIDSLLPDTSASLFSNIDDKIWNLQVSPYEGLRLIYFPKDYSDLNFIRPDVGTQTNGLSTCMRFLVYGQNLPAGASVRVDLFRNFEAIPFSGMSDFVNMDFYKPKANVVTTTEPALDASSKINDNGAIITKLIDEKKLENFAATNGAIGYKDIDQPTYEQPVYNTPQFIEPQTDLPAKILTPMGSALTKIVKNSLVENKGAKSLSAKANRSGGIFGSLLDVAMGLGKTLISEGIENTVGKIPFVGGLISGAVKSGVNWLGNKLNE